MNILSPEQCEELISLGLDMSDATIFWHINITDTKGKKNTILPPFLSFYNSTQVIGLEKFRTIPTYSLEDILNKLSAPNNCSYISLDLIDPWTVSFRQCSFEGDYPVKEFGGINALDAAFKALFLWMINTDTNYEEAI